MYRYELVPETSEPQLLKRLGQVQTVVDFVESELIR